MVGKDDEEEVFGEREKGDGTAQRYRRPPPFWPPRAADDEEQGERVSRGMERRRE